MKAFCAAPSLLVSTRRRTHFTATRCTVSPPQVGTSSVTIRTPEGPPIAAWLAAPPGNTPSAPHRGVVLLTDILGHENAETLEYALSLAAAGLPTLVPDLFRGVPWDKSRPMTEYEEWRAPHTNERVAGDVGAAVAALRERGATSVGVLGFCFGGGRAMDALAAGDAGFDAAVVFYPTRFDAFAAGRDATCPLMAVFGDEDELVPAQVVEELQEGLRENGVMSDCEMAVFEGAGHAFAHHPVSEEDRADCEILKSQTAEWFRQHLQ